MKKYFALLITTILLTSTPCAFSAIQISTNTLGELTVADTGGKVIKTLGEGSVGEIVRTGNQSFKISYGKDLQGNANAILYADPAKPQQLTFTYQGKNITVSKEAVLTLIIDGNGTILQSGTLGQVTVGNEKMSPSASLRISNSGTVIASKTPTTPAPAASPNIQAAAVKSVPATAANHVAASSQSPVVISYVTGKVFISQNGGTESSMNELSEIKVGTTIRTSQDGVASFHLFPSTTTTLAKNSTLTVKELSFTDAGPQSTRRFVGFLSAGKLLNDLDVKGKGTTHYQVQTPQNSFLAIGTRFVVSVDPEAGQSLVQVQQGIVSASDGSKIYAKVQGSYAANVVPQFQPMDDDNVMRIEDEKRGYVKRYINPALEEVINQAQAPFSPRLVPQEITPTGPQS
jgi:hypothetical protein